VKAAAAKEEEKPKEEEADVDMGGLFGDDYWATSYIEEQLGAMAGGRHCSLA
jgi:hypothetical protein